MREMNTRVYALIWRRSQNAPIRECTHSLDLKVGKLVFDVAHTYDIVTKPLDESKNQNNTR